MDMDELDESLNAFGALAFPTCAADGEGVLSAARPDAAAHADITRGQAVLAALGDKLRDANANNITASAVRANAAFRKTATAPEVGAPYRARRYE